MDDLEQALLKKPFEVDMRKRDPMNILGRAKDLVKQGKLTAEVNGKVVTFTPTNEALK